MSPARTLHRAAHPRPVLLASALRWVTIVTPIGEVGAQTVKSQGVSTPQAASATSPHWHKHTLRTQTPWSLHLLNPLIRETLHGLLCTTEKALRRRGLAEGGCILVPYGSGLYERSGQPFLRGSVGREG